MLRKVTLYIKVTMAKPLLKKFIGPTSIIDRFYPGRACWPKSNPVLCVPFDYNAKEIKPGAKVSFNGKVLTVSEIVRLEPVRFNERLSWYISFKEGFKGSFIPNLGRIDCLTVI